MTLIAVYGPTPVARGDPAMRGPRRGRFRRSPGAEPHHLQDRTAARDDWRLRTARRNARSARTVLRDLGQGVRVSLVVGRCRCRRDARRRSGRGAEREIRPDCEMLQGIGETYFLSTMASMLARAVLEQGRDEEALAWTETAERSAAEDDVEAQVDWRCVRALILARRGALEEAEALARKAVELAIQTEASAIRASTLSDLATVLCMPSAPKRRAKPSPMRSPSIRRKGTSRRWRVRKSPSPRSSKEKGA